MTSRMMRKMKTVIIDAHPLTRFHFGKLAIDNKTGLSDTSGWLSSDALFSALVNNVAKYKADQTVAFIKLFKDGKVRISSLFYCLSNGEKNIYFLPKPVNASTKLPEDTDYPIIKRIKKVRFVSQTVLETYSEKWVENLTELRFVGNAVLLNQECTEDFKKEVDGLYMKGFAPHINSRPLPPKDEENSETKTPQNELFQTAYVQLPLYRHWKSSLYFLMDDESLNEEEQKLLNFAVELIRFEGLGGKRNVGYGWIDNVNLNPVFPFEWTPKTEISKSITTGLLIPKDLEEFEKLEAYDLVRRGGRKIDSKITLKEVNMIAEGALLKGIDQPKGKLADISPNEDSVFLRLGSCITLPLNETES